MLYAFVRPLAKIGLKYYFRHIDLANAAKIPPNAAVILAANHPTTFIEPCVLACFLEQPLHFMARGDFFKNPLVAKILDGVHIIPVFRLRDGGYQGVKNNYESFDRATQVLRQKKNLMILAEGRCIHEKRLRPIRKGTGRIALGALDSTDLDEVYIVPVGVNFTYSDRPRSNLMINCGEPIRVSKFLDNYRTNSNLAINQLTEELQTRLAQEVVIINNLADEPLLENLLRLYRTEEPRDEHQKISPTDRFLRAEKQIADRINDLPEAEKTALTALSHDYFSRLERMRITDASFRGQYRAAGKKHLTVLLGLTPMLLLLFWHLPPILLVQWFSGVKMDTLEFASPVKWAGLLVAYLLYSIFWCLLAVFTGAWWLLGWVAVELLAASYLIRYGELAHRWLLHWRTRRQAEHEIKYLRQVRSQLVAQVKEFWNLGAFYGEE